MFHTYLFPIPRKIKKPTQSCVGYSFYNNSLFVSNLVFLLLINGPPRIYHFPFKIPLSNIRAKKYECCIKHQHFSYGCHFFLSPRFNILFIYLIKSFVKWLAHNNLFFLKKKPTSLPISCFYYNIVHLNWMSYFTNAKSHESQWNHKWNSKYWCSWLY